MIAKENMDVSADSLAGFVRFTLFLLATTLYAIVVSVLATALATAALDRHCSALPA